MGNVNLILYTSKTLANGEHPIVLYANFGKVGRISLGYSCSKKQWDEKKGRFRKSVINYEAKNTNLRRFELKASQIIDKSILEGKTITFDEFKAEFTGNRTEETFYSFFEKMITEKESLGKIGTKTAYRDAYNAMKRFHPEPLAFNQFNYTFLKGLETFLFQCGCKAGGIGSYFRSIRAVYYESIRRGLVNKELNPFSTTMNKSGYSLSKLKSDRNPRAMSKEELEALKSFDREAHPELRDAWLMFMFSFYQFGINFSDMATLKRADLHHNRLLYTRQKTKKSFNIKLKDEAANIISQFDTGTAYLFPVYNDQKFKTPQQKKDRIKRVLRKVNSDLKKIAKICGIQTNITFYTARHTSATTLKRNGVSTEIISEALGHSNPLVTQSYLQKFDSIVLDEAMDCL